MLPALDKCRFPTCYLSLSPYGYRPSLSVDVTFLVVYLCVLVGCGVAAWAAAPSRRWLAYSGALVALCALEMVGFGVRIGSYLHPWDVGYYAVSTVVLTVAPVLVSTAIYTTTPKLLHSLGAAEHSPLRPAHFKHLAHLFDLGGLAVQLAGFRLAFSDLTRASGLGPAADRGSSVVAAGSALQGLALAAFFTLFGTTLLRARRANAARRDNTCTTPPPRSQGPPRLKLLLVAVVLFAAGCLLARDLFKVRQLFVGLDIGLGPDTLFLLRLRGSAGAGLGGPLARNEATAALYDGWLVAEAALALVLLHPAYALADGGGGGGADEDLVSRRTRMAKRRDTNLGGRLRTSGGKEESACRGEPARPKLILEAEDELVCIAV